jgi:hypothetical protein
MSTLRELLDQPGTRLEDVQRHLAALDPEGRIKECRTLRKKQQARLFELAADTPALTPEDMVVTAADGAPVRWYGRNTLPAFTHFEKHFRRQNGRIIGFNFNPPTVTFVAGPGYYTCRVDEARPRELLIDYTQVPEAAPADWPAVKQNSAGLSRLVYHEMHDYCRRVSDTVVIGAATRLGKPMGQYFVLCRG